MTHRSELLLPLTMFTAWLARGERGLSSEAIVSAVTGEQVSRYPSPGSDYPHDPADLRRCVQLIEQHPLLAFVFKDAMRAHGPVWAALIDVWDELAETLAAEMAEGTGKAPRTYARMREVIHAARNGVVL